VLNHRDPGNQEAFCGVGDNHAVVLDPLHELTNFVARREKGVRHQIAAACPLPDDRELEAE
jgi:hypothetical protein